MISAMHPDGAELYMPIIAGWTDGEIVRFWCTRAEERTSHVRPMPGTVIGEVHRSRVRGPDLARKHSKDNSLMISAMHPGGAEPVYHLSLLTDGENSAFWVHKRKAHAAQSLAKCIKISRA
jgi:hypothetical protein